MISLARVAAVALCAVLSCAAAPPAPYTSQARDADVASFELVWSTLRDRYWDKGMAGLNWQSVHAEYLAKVRQADTSGHARAAIAGMVELLPSSHLAIIPRSVYHHQSPAAASSKAANDDTSTEDDAANDNDDDSDADASAGLTVGLVGNQLVVERIEPNSGAAKAGVQLGWVLDAVDRIPTQSLSGQFPKPVLLESVIAHYLSGPAGSSVPAAFTTGDGKAVEYKLDRQPLSGHVVRFGNLPPELVQIEHRALDNGAGYIRLSLFLDPERVMPELEKALHELHSAPGIVLDLRNNPGGIALMGMGVAGWFTSQEGKRLGSMTSRETTLNFVINPRLGPYTGKLAILVNDGTASTSEILAQGLQDLHRARIFGTRTAGAALPSNIIRLPNGDRFQYPEANYTSVNGRVLESNGVQPDVVIEPTIPALLAGRDLPLEAASRWCLKGN